MAILKYKDSNGNVQKIVQIIVQQTPVDNALSATSTNPVQNKVVTEELLKKAATTDLLNYYLKTETYSKTEVNNLVQSMSSLQLQVVSQLPTQDISTTTIYLVPNSSGESQNIYDEYIYVSAQWEKIGNTSISPTTYSLSKSGSTITLTGSDGSTSSVTDSNTTYTNESLGQVYGTCSTAEATTTKTVSVSSYTLKVNGIVSIKFTEAVPANATLNINSKGEHAIYYKGSAIISGIIKAGDTATFIYNGGYYHLISIDNPSVKTLSSTSYDIWDLDTDIYYTTNVGFWLTYSNSGGTPKEVRVDDGKIILVVEKYPVSVGDYTYRWNFRIYTGAINYYGHTYYDANADEYVGEYHANVDSGTNATGGQYVKFEDGTMICYGSIDYTTTRAISAGSGGYRTGETYFNFPEEFASTPIVFTRNTSGASNAIMMR